MNSKLNGSCGWQKGNRHEPAFEEAIARHKAARAACDAAPDADDETFHPLSNALHTAFMEVAESPCASDAEFVEKLRYLFEEEISLNGGIVDHDYIVAAMGMHFESGSKVLALVRHQ